MDIENSSDVSNGSRGRRLTTVVATDICGYSALSEQNDSQAIYTVDTVYALFEKAVHTHHGRIFKRIADGFLAEFPNAESALHAAMEYTRSVKKAASSAPPPIAGIGVRTGIHVGDVTDREDGDILGHGVNVAVRLQEQAQKNGTLASQNIIDLFGENFPYDKSRRGSLLLKNISKPLVVFDVFDVSTTAFTIFIQKLKLSLKKPIRLGITPMVGLSLIWLGNTVINSKALNTRIEKVQSTFFTNPAISAYENDLNASYMYRILQDLAESKQPSDQAVFALIEKGNVTAAVAALEEALETLPHDDPHYVATLHQIGALTYQREPKQAIAVYEKLVGLAPHDVAAITRLGRSYDVIGNVCKARRQYESALSFTPKNTDQFVKLELDRAFNFIMGGDAQKSLDVLEPYVADLRSRKVDPLWSLFQTEYGIALERAGETKLSNAVLSAAIHLQEQLKDDSNLSRSYNILGFLAVRNAQESPELSDLFYREAIGHFFKQLEIDNRIGRMHTLPGAHYFIAEVYQATADINSAEIHFTQGLELAEKHNVANFQFLNLLGLATIEDERSNRAETCELVANAQLVYDDSVDSGIGPKTKAKIAKLDCGFIFKPQPSLTACDD